MATQFLNRIGQLGLSVAIVGGVVNSALYNVDDGHRAVIFDRFTGVKQQISGEGTHFSVPWDQRPILFDIRSQPRNVPVVTGSEDLLNVLPKIYTILGQDYDERVLSSITTEVLKAVLVQFDAGELITQREMVSQKVSDDMFSQTLNVNQESVRKDWLKTSSPFHVQRLMERYGVFGHLFGAAYVVPRVDLKISFQSDEVANPVYYENILKPLEAAQEPNIQFDPNFDFKGSSSAESVDTWWTLVLTNPELKRQRILSLVGFEHSPWRSGQGGTDCAVSAADSAEGNRRRSLTLDSTGSERERG